MAMQNNLTISQPSFVAESSASTKVEAKNRKKQQQELAQLASLLKVVDEELVGAKASSGNSSTNEMDALAELALVLQRLRSKIDKFNQAKSKMNTEIDESLGVLAKSSLKELKELTKLLKGLEDIKRNPFKRLLWDMHLLFTMHKEIELIEKFDKLFVFNKKGFFGFFGKNSYNLNKMIKQVKHKLTELRAQQEAPVGTAAFIRKEEKNREKELKALNELKLLLQLMQAEASKGGKQVNSSGAPSNKAHMDALAEMVLTLQLLQVAIAKFGQAKAKMDYENANAQITLAKNLLHKIKDNIKKLKKEEAKRKKEGFWIKFGEVFAAVVVSIVAVVTLQPEIAAVMVGMTAAMLTLSMTGALSKLTDRVAGLLESDGLSKKDAEIFAAIIVSLTVMIASAAIPTGELTSAVSGAEKIANTAETATTAAEESTEEVTSTTQQVVDTVKSGFSKVGAALKKANPFRNLSVRQNLMVMNTMMALSQTGFIRDIAGEIASAQKMSDSQKQKLEEGLEIGFAATTGLVAIGSGSAVFESMGNAATLTSKAERAVTLLERLSTYVKPSRVLNVAIGAQFLAQAGESAAKGMEGGTMIAQGEIEYALADLNGQLHLDRTAEQMSNEQTTADQQAQAQTLQNDHISNGTIQNLLKGMEGFANLFAYSPV